MDERRALSRTLQAAIASQALGAVRDACFFAVALPTALLVLHSRWPLPTTLARLAAAAWTVIAVTGIAASVASRAWRQRFDRRRWDSDVAARVILTAEPALHARAVSLAGLATAIGGLFSLHAVAPGVLSPAVLAGAGVTWAVTIGTSVGARTRPVNLLPAAFTGSLRARRRS